MRATVVPAQVTTVEDRVAGNLSFIQLILLAIPVFGGSLLYAVMPPSMESARYKLIIISVIAVIGLTLAVRVKGKIVLLWLIVLLAYHRRPRRYLFTKNTSAYRQQYSLTLQHIAKTDAVSATHPKQTSNASALMGHERAIAQAKLDDPLTRTRFEATKKGGLYVHLSKIKE